MNTNIPNTALAALLGARVPSMSPTLKAGGATEQISSVQLVIKGQRVPVAPPTSVPTIGKK